MVGHRRDEPTWRNLLPFGRRHRRFLARGLVATVLLVATRLAFPLPLVAIVERASTPAGQAPVTPDLVPGWGNPVVWLAAAFVALALLGGLAEHRQRLAFARFSSRTINDVRSVAMTRVGEPGFRAHYDGDLVVRVVVDSARIKQGLKGVLNHITRNGLLFIGICSALFITDVPLGLAQLAGGAVVAVVAIFGATRVTAVAKTHREGEALLAEEVRRALADGADEVDVDDIDADSGVADIEMTRWEGRTTWAVHMVLAATAGVVLALGRQAAEAGRLGAGSLFSVVAYLILLHWPTVRLARQVTRIGPVLVSATRLAMMVDDPVE